MRNFAFSSHLGEVSELFNRYPLEKAIELVNWQYGGATDYGNSLLDFRKLAIDDIDCNNTVIILGDARYNDDDAKWRSCRVSTNAQNRSFGGTPNRVNCGVVAILRWRATRAPAIYGGRVQQSGAPGAHRVSITT